MEFNTPPEINPKYVHKEQRPPAQALYARALFPARVHDARAERSTHNKEGMEGREVWGAAARL